MATWYNARDDDVWEFDPVVPELWESENPVVGTILGPDGGVLHEVTARPRRVLGFRPGGG